MEFASAIKNKTAVNKAAIYNTALAVGFLGLGLMAGHLATRPIYYSRTGISKNPSPTEKLLAQTNRSFERVFDKQGMPALKLVKEAEKARLCLMPVKISHGEQAVVICQTDRNYAVTGTQIVKSQRPEPGESKICAGGKYLLSRPSKQSDPGGVFSEIHVSSFIASANARAHEILREIGKFGLPKNAKGEISCFLNSKKTQICTLKCADWVSADGLAELKLVKNNGKILIYGRRNPSDAFVLAAKVHGGSRDLVVSPYSDCAMSGSIARAALDYMAQSDSLARAALEKYSSNGETKALLARVPPKMNVLICIVEAIGPESLSDMPRFERSLSRILYHIATQREISKFLTKSKVGATGPFQFMPSTERLILGKLGNEPLSVFAKFASESGYLPAKYLVRQNRLCNYMYSSILGLYHHADVLSYLQSNCRLKYFHGKGECARTVEGIRRLVEPLGFDPQDAELQGFLQDSKRREHWLTSGKKAVALVKQFSSGGKSAVIQVSAGPNLLYLTPEQTVLAIAMGYNGGGKAPMSAMNSAIRKGDGTGWHEQVFASGVSILRELACRYENLGYGVKTCVVSPQMKKDYAPDSQMSPLNTSAVSYYNIHSVQPPHIAPRVAPKSQAHHSPPLSQQRKKPAKSFSHRKH
ncbi:MAG: hypothetical protein NT051_01940 [Candidatus Micrarchaeota archaeon]|nr:hypothetical protein [Candidatus Micrarchaeota archaeon]